MTQTEPNKIVPGDVIDVASGYATFEVTSVTPLVNGGNNIAGVVRTRGVKDSEEVWLVSSAVEVIGHIVPDDAIQMLWHCEECKTTAMVPPTFYEESGTPVCEECDLDMSYVHMRGTK